MISESVVNHSPRTENQSVCSPISGPQQRGGSRPARIFYNQDVRNSAMTISDYMIHHVMESEHTGPNDPKDLIDVDQNYSSCLKLVSARQKSCFCREVEAIKSGGRAES